jgi:hypothetical protein
MPAHRNALKHLLASTEQQILVAERQQLGTTNDAERSKLIDKLANLHVTHENLKAILAEQDPPI